jgi:hypothetical protein
MAWAITRHRTVITATIRDHPGVLLAVLHTGFNSVLGFTREAPPTAGSEPMRRGVGDVPEIPVTGKPGTAKQGDRIDVTTAAQARDQAIFWRFM